MAYLQTYICTRMHHELCASKKELMQMDGRRCVRFSAGKENRYAEPLLVTKFTKSSPKTIFPESLGNVLIGSCCMCRM